MEALRKQEVNSSVLTFLPLNSQMSHTLCTSVQHQMRETLEIHKIEIVKYHKKTEEEGKWSFP